MKRARGDNVHSSTAPCAVSHAAGFVLVGGKSSRMGRNKAFLAHRSGLLIEEVAESVAAVTGNVALIGNPDVYGDLLDYECLADVRPGCGPLSGIHTALTSRRGEYNLILACDMPGIDRALLACLVASAQQRRARCVVAADPSGQVHPLCAVYHATSINAVESAMEASDLSLIRLLDKLEAVRLFTPLTISNCNSPEEWAAVQRL